MPALKDLTGKTFNNLLVVNRATNSPSNRTRWTCLCSCGNSTIIQSWDLISGHSKSCGCLLTSYLHRIDLTGSRFSRLLVVSKTNTSSAQNRLQYNCLCDCGTSVIVDGHSLTQKLTTSCGCFNKERSSLACIKRNKSYRLALGENPDIPLSVSRGNFRRQFQESNIRTKSLKRDNFKCILCESNKCLHVHHIVPLSSDYTKNMELSNLITLCEYCHINIAHPKKNMNLIDSSFQELFQEYTNFYN